MIKNIKAITLSSYLAMFFLGIGTSLIGAAARSIGLTAYQIGLLVAAQNVGFILSVLLAGVLADKFQKPRVMLAGSLLLSFSFFTFYLSELFWVNLGLMLLFGAGMGVYEGVADAMVLQLHPNRATLHINVNHFFVTFGAILIAAYLPLLQSGWRQSVVQVSLAVLVLALFFGLARLENKYHQAEKLRDRLYLLGRDRRIVALALATALATGVELTSINILTTFLVELRDFTHMASTIGLIVYLVGIAGGRLLVGFFTRKSQLVPYMLSMFGLALLFFSGLFFLPWGRAIYVIIFLSGLALSAILPLIISLAGLLYQEMAGTAMGIIKTAIPVGGILLPFLMSMLAQYLSFQVSLLLLPLALLLALAILYTEYKTAAASKVKAS